MALSEFDEINAGVCEGMRYSDVRDGMPLEYEARSHNKYGYIYPDVPYTYIPQNQYYHITITQRRKLFEMIRYA